MGTIEKSVTINATPERIVSALTKADQLTKWFPSEAKTEPGTGGRYYLRFTRPGEDDHEVDGEFTQVSPQKVSTSWPMGELGETEVDWDLSPAGSGTRVRMVHKGIGDGGPWDQVRSMMDPGWEMFVNNLKNFLEGGSDLRKG